MESKLRQKDILQQLSKKEFVQQTIQQIEKDFAMCGQEINFQSPTIETYKQLISELKNTVAYLCERDFTKFTSILYRIDIPEQTIAEITINSNPQEVYSNLTELIVIREAKKVIIKNYFSQKL